MSSSSDSTSSRDRSIPYSIHPDRAACGAAAACRGAEVLRDALDRDGRVSIVVATGASQLEMLENLVQEPDLAWERVTIFHLDEYIGIPVTHPASFRRYLWERFHRRLDRPPSAFHYIAGEGDPQDECRRLGAIIRDQKPVLGLIGIGENGHLAFNDPPADFETRDPYLVVELDEACRRQQLGEGWFPTFDDVPKHAISMSIQQILLCRHLVLTVPDARKANAVSQAISGPVTPDLPASILQKHPQAHLFLDQESASGISAGR